MRDEAVVPEHKNAVYVEEVERRSSRIQFGAQLIGEATLDTEQSPAGR